MNETALLYNQAFCVRYGNQLNEILYSSVMKCTSFWKLRFCVASLISDSFGLTRPRVCKNPLMNGKRNRPVITDLNILTNVSPSTRSFISDTRFSKIDPFSKGKLTIFMPPPFANTCILIEFGRVYGLKIASDSKK